MGKGIIVDNLGKGKYTVDVQHETSRPPKMIAYYDQVIYELSTVTVPDAVTAFNDARYDLEVADAAAGGKATTWMIKQTTVLDLTQQIAELKLSLQELPPIGPEEREAVRAQIDALEAQLEIAEKELEIAYKAVLEEIKKVSAAQLVYNEKLRAKNDAYTDLTNAQKLKDLWEDRNDFPETDNQDLWVVDLSGKTGEVGYASIPNGSEVSLLELDLVNGTMIVDSAYPDGLKNVYEPGFGLIQPPKAATENGWFYNMMMLPGVISWRNKWGSGVITAIDYDADTCSIQRTVSPGASSALPFPMSWDTSPITTKTFDDVPIEYMQCNARAFKTGDNAVIEFNEGGEPNKVIGFVEKPKPCPTEVAVQFYDSVNDNYPRLTYDPVTALWTRTTDNNPLTAKIQYRRGADLISMGLPDGLGDEDCTVFWNRVNQGAARSGGWYPRCAWIDEDDRLISVQYYYNTYYDFDEQRQVSEWAFDVSTKTGAGGWVSIHNTLPPKEFSAGGDNGHVINHGWWVSDDGKTVRFGGANKFYAEYVINVASVDITEFAGVDESGTVTADAYCINSDVPFQIAQDETFATRSTVATHGYYYHSTHDHDGNVWALQSANWYSESLRECGRKQPVDVHSTDRSWWWRRTEGHTATDDYGGFYDLKGESYLETFTAERGGDFWNTADYADEFNVENYWLSRTAEFTGLYTDAALVFEDVRPGVVGTIEISVYNAGVKTEVVIERSVAEDREQLVDSTCSIDSDCAEPLQGAATISNGGTDASMYLKREAKLHPTGQYAMNIQAWVAPADYGLYLSNRGKSNDLIPELADCEMLGWLDGYNPDEEE